jgi:UDP-N-acetylglucosamine--N-acetylmuramyl-(pentapeptide) pyrophosphoryl-undecaprenol N-acetylglucosamine transferase
MEPDLSVEALAALLADLFASDTKLPQAAAVASTMARPQAAANLADQVERMLAARGER